MPIDATRPYDENNIFARILRGEIPCSKVYEDEHALAFNDINPQAPTHVLVIPKGAYVSWDDFSQRASDAEIAGYVRAVGKVARAAGLVEPGYRLLANVGADSGQVALRMLPNGWLDPLFSATVQATEEAITNAMLAAETMTGADGVRGSDRRQGHGCAPAAVPVNTAAPSPSSGMTSAANRSTP